MSISLPPDIAREIKLATKSEKCATQSEFIRHLMRLWRTHSLTENLKKQSKEFRAGRGILLKSLSDLD